MSWDELEKVLRTQYGLCRPLRGGNDDDSVAKILGKHPGLTVFQIKTLLRALAANVRREEPASPPATP